jgi:tRNA (guanine37-N1)-methyltransferase
MNSENLAIPEPSAVIHFDVFTLFPQMFVGPLSESIIKRAQDNRLMTVALHDIRTYTTDRHHICDDTPYGGGGGMVMKPEPIFRAVETVLSRPAGWTLAAGDAYSNLPPWDAAQRPDLPGDVPVILLTPQGRPLTQAVVTELAQRSRLALICGRYEGVDERVHRLLVTDEISIGDYVLSGGELAAMVIIDAVTRLVPGALGFALGAHQDSHSPGLRGLLEGPQYTRPPLFRGEAVPDVLLSGHHGNVARWRWEQALLRTLARRPELLPSLPLSDADRAFLQRWGEWDGARGQEAGEKDNE